MPNYGKLNESPEAQERGHRCAVRLSYVGGQTYDRGLEGTAPTQPTTGWPNGFPPYSHVA